MNFGNRLVEARNQAGLSQKRLAEILEITPSRLNYWEKNKREPDVSMIKKIATTLHVSADYLIGNEVQKVPLSFEMSPAEQEHIKKYHTLDRYGKEMVDSILDREFDYCHPWSGCSKAITQIGKTIDYVIKHHDDRHIHYRIVDAMYDTARRAGVDKETVQAKFTRNMGYGTIANLKTSLDDYLRGKNDNLENELRAIGSKQKEPDRTAIENLIVRLRAYRKNHS